MPGLTEDVGAFLAAITFNDLPKEMLPTVRDAFTDTVGVVMAGIDLPLSEILWTTLVRDTAPKEVRACLSQHKVDGPGAALLAGAIAHALDYGCQTASGHPGGVIIPAILAEAEVLGSSGEEMVTAFVAGYEVWCEVWRRNKYYHRAGWHPTALLGPLASAAACCVLRKMSVEKSQNAIAIAASHAGGLFSNFGSMTKGFHSGKGARDGLIAARLADAGMTGGPDALESRQGFLTAFASGGAPDRESPSQLGKEWYLPRQKLQFKMHPSCFFSHRSFEGTLRMLNGRDIDPDDVESVEVEMGRGQTTVLVHDHPKTMYQAQFSGPFGIAAAVILGKFGPPEIKDEVVQRDDMQAFYPKVKLVPVDEEDPRDPVFSPTERVRMTLTSGEVLDSGPIATIPGYAAEPLTTEELWGKFRDCTRATHGDVEAKELFDLLQRIDALPSTAALPTCATILND